MQRSFKRLLTAAATVVSSMALAASTASANLLVNNSFELPPLTGGDTPGAIGWTTFGGAFTIRVAPQEGNQAFKIFGNPGGGFQDFPTLPGQQWIGSVFGLHFNGDPLSGAQIGAVNIEWRNAGGLISFESTQVVNAGTPQGSLPGDYVFGQVTGTAPAGATTARFVLITGAFAGPGGGAVWFDNASFDLVPEPATIGLMAIGVPAVLMRRRRA